MGPELVSVLYLPFLHHAMVFSACYLLLISGVLRDGIRIIYDIVS